MWRQREDLAEFPSVGFCTYYLLSLLCNHFLNYLLAECLPQNVHRFLPLGKVFCSFPLVGEFSNLRAILLLIQNPVCFLVCISFERRWTRQSSWIPLSSFSSCGSGFIAQEACLLFCQLQQTRLFSWTSGKQIPSGLWNGLRSRSAQARCLWDPHLNQ
jgi:hypothetical protein